MPVTGILLPITGKVVAITVSAVVFGPAEAINWFNMRRIIEGTLVAEVDNVVSWALEASGQFSTSSAYRALCQGSVTEHFKGIWRVPLPFKIKIFLWQLISTHVCFVARRRTLNTFSSDATTPNSCGVVYD